MCSLVFRERFRTAFLYLAVSRESFPGAFYSPVSDRARTIRQVSHFPDVSRTIFTTSEPTASNIISMFWVYSELWLMIASFTRNAL